MSGYHAEDRALGGQRVRSGSTDTATRPGPGKDICADRAFAIPGLIGVLDGVSQTKQPDRAADLAAMWVAAQLVDQQLTLGLLSDTVIEAVNYLEQRTQSHDPYLTATTISLAAVTHAPQGDRLLLACTIGDSPVGYITATGRIIWISAPDARHDLHAEGDDRVRSRGPLTQALAPGTTLEPNLWVTALPEGASALVASDGLLDIPKPASELLSLPAYPSARGLIEAAANAGSRDDIAVALHQPDLLYGHSAALHQPTSRRRWRSPH